MSMTSSSSFRPATGRTVVPTATAPLAYAEPALVMVVSIRITSGISAATTSPAAGGVAPSAVPMLASAPRVAAASANTGPTSAPPSWSGEMLLTAFRKSFVTKSPSLMAGRASRSTCTQFMSPPLLPPQAGTIAAAERATAMRIQFLMVVILSWLLGDGNGFPHVEGRGARAVGEEGDRDADDDRVDVVALGEVDRGVEVARHDGAAAGGGGAPVGADLEELLDVEEERILAQSGEDLHGGAAEVDHAGDGRGRDRGGQDRSAADLGRC